MSDSTEIQWTDSTWNVVTGCTRVSPGCARCYIERTPPFRMNGRRFATVGGGESSTGVTLHWDRLEKVPRGPKVFTPSLGDLFHEQVPDSFIAEVFDVMRLRPDRVFQVLTKRPERARDWFVRYSPAFERFLGGVWPLPNVWLGVSIENARYAWRADVLREITAAVRFISAEPLLGSLFETTLRDMPSDGLSKIPIKRYVKKPLDLTGIDWVIVGGESGPRARPFHLEHAREIIRACGFRDERGLPIIERTPDPLPAIFVKQLGARPVERSGRLSTGGTWTNGPMLLDRKGGDWDEWPADLRIREFPRSAAA